MREILPTLDRLVVKRKDPETATVAGLFIPEMAQTASQEAEVIKVGPAVESVYVGDTVLIGKYAGSQLLFGGEEYQLILESEVLARII